MQRRPFLLASAALLGGAGAAPVRRPRPGSAAWPSDRDWAGLAQRVGGRLQQPRSPFARCMAAPDGSACRDALTQGGNPWFLGDEPALTQASGWAGAWQSTPSAWAVAAESAADVAAAVDFARTHRLRLVVKGGGHSYQGTSCAPDSLLVWTRRLRRIALHDAFVPQGASAAGAVAGSLAGTPDGAASGVAAPRPAVSLGAGVVWQQAYDAVAVRGGRYVQGGGCATVGVAGLVLSGGFGSFSKRYGLAASSLLEAEIVTADGQIRVVNPGQEPELFWALKGGGGGSFGVVTRLTLATHDLPATFGGAFGTVRATSDAAFRRLIARFLAFYAYALFDPHWGEQVRIRPDNRLEIMMVFQDLDAATAEARWQPFRDWLAQAPAEYRWENPLQVLAAPARRFWDAAWLQANVPDMVMADSRPDADPANIFWAGDAGQAGQFLHGYQSAWLPARLLAPDARPRLAEALFAASRHWGVSLHLNKGLAGAPPDVIAAARDTATHPAVTGAFALAISGGAGPPAYAGMPGATPDLDVAAQDAPRIAAAMAALRRSAGATGSYVSESDFFQPDWQDAFWGPHYPRLLAAKRRYDPEGLFFVHHGVGSEGWSADGFEGPG